MNSVKVFYFVLLLLAFVSCKKKSVVSLPKSNFSMDSSNVEYVPTGIFYEQRLSQFKWLTAKLRISDEGNGNLPVGISVSVRIRKDSAIWLSFSPGLGIEAMRILATVDSVKILDKINHNKSQLSYRQLSLMLGANLDYSAFESLLLGNLPFPKKFSVIGQTPEFTLLFTKFGGVTQSVNISKGSSRMTSYLAKNLVDSSRMVMDCSDFKEVEGVFFPFMRMVDIHIPVSKESVMISSYGLKFIRVQVVQEQLEMPFSMPEDYSWEKR